MQLDDRALTRLLDACDDPVAESRKAIAAACAVLAKHRGEGGALDTLNAYAAALAERRADSPTDV